MKVGFNMSKIVKVLIALAISIATLTIDGSYITVNAATLPMNNGQVVMDTNNGDYKGFIDAVTQSVISDIGEGFKRFKAYGGGDEASDHVALSKWGKFLYDYDSKSVAAMPQGAINLPLVDGVYTIGDTRENKTWVKDQLLPRIHEAILEGSKNYAFNINAYRFDTPIVFDKENSVLGGSGLTRISVMNPLIGKVEKSNEVEIIVHSVGDYYGVQLNTRYVSLLGALEDKDSLIQTVQIGKNVESAQETKGVNCVLKFAYIVVPKVGENASKVSDYALMANLVVNILTREIVKLKSLETYTYDKLSDEEIKNLNENTFVLSGLSDGLVAIPTIYKEYFHTSNGDYPTGYTVDIKDYLINQSSVHIVDGKAIDFNTYISDDNLVTSVKDKVNNFVLFADSTKTPYDRVIAWLGSDESNSFVNEKEKKVLLGKIKNIYKSAGKSDEYKTLLKSNNISFINYGLIGMLVGGVVIVTGGVFFIKNRKNKKVETNGKPSGKNDLLIPINDDEE